MLVLIFSRPPRIDPCVILTAHGYDLEIETLHGAPEDTRVLLRVTMVGQDRNVLTLRASSPLEAVRRAYAVIAVVHGWETLTLADFHPY